MAVNINHVVITGNLTKDPELRHTPSGTPVCKLRLAVNSRRKDGGGNWVDKPNYFDVVVWGNQGEACAQYLAKGRPIAVQGRLEWSEWSAQDGTKRQKVEIVAETVQFLHSRGSDSQPYASEAAPAPAQGRTDFESSDDDIPFAFLDRWGCEPVASVRHGCPTRTTTKLHLR
jgi:single-strand DNA-binding protein